MLQGPVCSTVHICAAEWNAELYFNTIHFNRQHAFCRHQKQPYIDRDLLGCNNLSLTQQHFLTRENLDTADTSINVVTTIGYLCSSKWPPSSIRHYGRLIFWLFFQNSNQKILKLKQILYETQGSFGENSRIFSKNSQKLEDFFLEKVKELFENSRNFGQPSIFWPQNSRNFSKTLFFSATLVASKAAQMGKK